MRQSLSGSQQVARSDHGVEDSVEAPFAFEVSWFTFRFTASAARRLSSGSLGRFGR
jgi:hypothetical protein